MDRSRNLSVICVTQPANPDYLNNGRYVANRAMGRCLVVLPLNTSKGHSHSHKRQGKRWCERSISHEAVVRQNLSD
jgi:hypothetical protein